MHTRGLNSGTRSTTEQLVKGLTGKTVSPSTLRDLRGHVITTASPFDARRPELAYNYHLPGLRSEMSKRLEEGSLYAAESSVPQATPYNPGYDGRKSEPDAYSAEGHRGKLN